MFPVVAFLGNALFDGQEVKATKIAAKVRTLVKEFSAKMEMRGNSSGDVWGSTEVLLKKIVDFVRTKKEGAAELKALSAAVKADHRKMELGYGMAQSLASTLDTPSVAGEAMANAGEAMAKARADEVNADTEQEAQEAQRRGDDAALAVDLAASQDFAGGGGVVTPAALPVGGGFRPAPTR